MNDLWRRFCKQARSFLRLHVDLPTILILLLLIVLFNQMFLPGVLKGINFLGTKWEFPEWVSDFILNVSASILSALIIVPSAIWFFKVKRT